MYAYQLMREEKTLPKSFHILSMSFSGQHLRLFIQLADNIGCMICIFITQGMLGQH